PGTYSLAARSPDEMVAVDLLLGQCPGEPRPDVVLAIVDASNLDRHLYLVTQLLDLGLPVVVALNMTDVAASHGITIDVAKLSERLNLPVVPIQANKGRGVAQLADVIWQAAEREPSQAKPQFPEAFEREVATVAEALGDVVPQFLLRRLLLDVGGHTERRLSEQFGPGIKDRIAAARQRLTAASC